jgi:hypothetical protein
MRRAGDQNTQIPEIGDFINNDEKPCPSELKIMRINFILFNVAGLLPPDRAGPWIQLIYKVFIAGILLMEVLILLCQLTAVVVHWGDLHLVSNTVCIMNAFILSFVSGTYFLHNKSKILKLIDLLTDKFVVKAKSKHIKLIKRAERHIKIYLYLSSPAVLCLTCSWALAPFINRNLVLNIEAKNVTKKGPNFEKMIFIMWTPFDIEQSPHFEIISVLQVFLLNFGAGILYAVCMTFLALMSHSAAQFKVLVAMLNDMHEHISLNELPTTETVCSPCSTIRGRDVINNVTERHKSANDTMTISSWNETGEQYSNYDCNVKFLKHIYELENMHEDKFQQYLVYCIKYHKAVIE